MPEQSHRYGSLLVSICLAAAIIAVYLPVYGHDFVKYDDDFYVSNNANIKSGLNFSSIRWAFTSRRYAHNWHPVTWLSHIVDYQLFGDWAGGHHLVNVLFHILNTLILFYVFQIMTKSLWPSAFVAAAFALHPLHVESVAWIAERKDVLSTFFWFLTMWAYVRYVENPKLKWYLTALILFILGLMSKPMLVTLPFVLLLLDYWPLERKFSKTLIIEKIPFFLCSLASSVITFIVQRGSGAAVGIEWLSLASRINNAIVSYIMYIAKMFWPSRLAVLYPHPGSSLPISKVIICVFLLLLITAAVIYFGRRYKFLAVGWLWYLGTLVPVIGLVQVGSQAMADRYTYITLTGLFIIIGWGAKEIISGKGFILTFSAVILLCALAFMSQGQVKYWKNTSTLFERTLSVTKNNLLIHESYANYLFEMEKYDSAIEELNKFLLLKPAAAKSRCNLGCALMWTGRADEAIEQFELTIKYKPDFALAYNNLAAALHTQGRDEEAVEYYRQTLKLQPNFIEARLRLCAILTELKRFEEIIEVCDKAVEMEPNNPAVRGYLAQSLAAVGKTDEAIEEIRFILRAHPDSIEMNRNLGLLLERQGKLAEAAEAYRAALRIDPNDASAVQLLENVLNK
jgi:Flp pilus assembly protein TadD